MEVPAPGAGTVREIVAKVGDKVAMGSLILRLERSRRRRRRAAPPRRRAGARRAVPAARRRRRPPSRAGRRRRRAGSGRFFGRARRARRAPSRARARPRSDHRARHRRKGPHHERRRQGGAGRRQSPAARPRRGSARNPGDRFFQIRAGRGQSRLSRIKRISGPRLHASWLNVPHVTHSDEADVTELDAFRKRLDDEAKADKKAPYRVSLLPLLMKASVAPLKAFPTFNSVADPGQGRAGLQEILAHRRRLRHAGRPGRRRWSGTSTARASSNSRGSSARCRPRRAKASFRRPKCRARASPSPRSAASAARLHADRQCAGSRHPRRRARENGAGVGRQGVRCRA